MATPGSDLREPATLEAERWIEAGRFEPALATWREIAARDPSSPRAQARIAACLMGLGRFEDAHPILERLAQASPDNPLVLYRLAIARAAVGDPDGAIHGLDGAAANGLRATSGIDDEPALGAIRDHARFAEIRRRIERNDRPTMDEPRRRTFDFWVGTWEARTEDGVLQGINRISRELGGAVIVERWMGVSGYRGMSLNRYDPRTDRWCQTWIDDQGDAIEFVDGVAADGRLVFGATDPDGGRRRLTFEDHGPDALRQLAERSADGESWTTEYDFRYRRLAADPEISA